MKLSQTTLFKNLSFTKAINSFKEEKQLKEGHHKAFSYPAVDVMNLLFSKSLLPLHRPSMSYL